MLRRLLILTTLILPLLSCSKKEKEDEEWFRYFKKSTSIKQCIDTKEEIQIEENEKSYLTWPFRLLVMGDKYLISSGDKSLKVFDKNGKFLHSIGRIGSGPGEYRESHNLIKITENEFAIYDYTNRSITRFNLNGKFISIKKVKFAGLGLFKHILYNSGNYFFLVPYTKEIPYHIVVLDSNMNKFKYLIPASQGYEGYTPSNMMNGSMYIDKDKSLLYMMNSFSGNSIHVVNLLNWSEEKTEVKGIKFFTPISEYKNGEKYEIASKNFVSGTDVVKIIPYKNLFFITYTITRYLIGAIFDPLLGKSILVKYLESDYFDGKYFYAISYKGTWGEKPSAENIKISKISYQDEEIAKIVKKLGNE